MIRTLYAFVVIDGRGEEGVLRRVTPIGTQPMIADSPERLQAFRSDALAMADQMSCVLHIAKFVREEAIA